MNEAGWLASEDAHDMVGRLRSQFNANFRTSGRRKLRLFGCACCRLLWDLMPDPRSRAAVEYMERFTDDEVDGSKMERVKADAQKVIRAVQERPVPAGMHWSEVPERLGAESAYALVGKRADSSAYAHWAMRTTMGRENARYQNWTDQLHTLAGVLRDVVGNPFGPSPKFNKKWRTDTVLTLARQMYASRDFSGMPILADALQDAGCNNDLILSHCRDANQTHVRGCWVVDLALEKSESGITARG